MTADTPGGPALTGATMAAAAGFDIALAPSVVLVYDKSIVPTKFGSRRQRRSQHPFRAVANGADNVDIVVAPGPGAPVAAVTTEFLASFGVQRLVTVGTAGQLAGPPKQSLRVIARAVSDEGTSAHYGDDLRADPDITKQLIAATGAPAAVTLTTDVPFRHFRGRLANHRQVAELVEMECAAVFATARCFGIQASALAVVSDIFDDATWTRFDPTKIATLLREAVATATQVLANQ